MIALTHTSSAPVPQSLSVSSFGGACGWDNAIVIPAKDEAKRIMACLHAAIVAVRNAGLQTTGILVVVNNSTDCTASHVKAFADAHRDTPFLLADCVFADKDAGVGSARRLGLDMAAEMVAANGALMTTDADSRVRPDWVVQTLAGLRRADMVCGTVLVDPDEARALPPEIAAHGGAEWEYLTACIALAAALDPQLHDPQPAHRNAPGASLALSRRAYLASGRLPVVQIGEDRALAAQLEAQDYRIYYAAEVIIETSCRLTGRTTGGMAGALRERAAEADPFADEWLEPVEAFALRHRLRGRLRAVWPDRNAVRYVIAQMLGYTEVTALAELPWPPHCSALIARLEARAPQLRRSRMRISDCRRELAGLQAILQTAQNAPLCVGHPLPPPERFFRSEARRASGGAAL